MTTNTNTDPRITVLIAAADALHVDADALNDVLDALLDVEPSTYDDDLRLLHVIADAMITSDDDYDDVRLALRVATDTCDDDDRALFVYLNHPFVANPDL